LQILLFFILIAFLGIDRYFIKKTSLQKNNSEIQIFNEYKLSSSSILGEKIRANNYLTIFTIGIGLIFFLNTYFLFLPAQILGIYIGQLSIIFNVFLVISITSWTFSKRLFIETSKTIAAEIILMFFLALSSLILINQIDSYMTHISNNTAEIKKIFSSNSIVLNNLYQKPLNFRKNFIPQDKLDLAFESEYQIYSATYYKKKESYLTYKNDQYPVNITDEYFNRSSNDLAQFYNKSTLYSLESIHNDEVNLNGTIYETIVPRINSINTELSRFLGIDESFSFILLTIIIINTIRLLIWSIRTLYPFNIRNN
jgi:hypothetical protein